MLALSSKNLFFYKFLLERAECWHAELDFFVIFFWNVWSVGALRLCLKNFLIFWNAWRVLPCLFWIFFFLFFGMCGDCWCVQLTRKPFFSFSWNNWLFLDTFISSEFLNLSARGMKAVLTVSNIIFEKKLQKSPAFLEPYAMANKNYSLKNTRGTQAPTLFLLTNKTQGIACVPWTTVNKNYSLTTIHVELKHLQHLFSLLTQKK